MQECHTEASLSQQRALYFAPLVTDNYGIGLAYFVYVDDVVCVLNESVAVMWQVGHVGPLSKAGGLIELARINSPDISAFTSVAWVPTLLPRHVLTFPLLYTVTFSMPSSADVDIVWAIISIDGDIFYAIFSIAVDVFYAILSIDVIMPSSFYVDVFYTMFN